MKLYFKNIELKNIIKNELLKTSITNKSMFYANEGIFTIEKTIYTVLTILMMKLLIIKIS